MNDSEFLTKILENPILKDSVQDLALRTAALNLVTPKWHEILESSNVFKRHTKQDVRFSEGREVRDKKVKIKNIIGTHNHYNVLVAGYWSLNRPLDVVKEGNTISFVCKLCNPLVAIGESMKEHSQGVTLQDNCKLFAESCNPIMCVDCAKYREKLSLDQENNWCIRTTRVFNGSTIMNTTKFMIEDAFLNKGQFMGILNVSISSRISFGHGSYKIGGVVKEMLLFKESAIYPRVNINLDLSLPAGQDVPSITYPAEEQEKFEEAIPASVSMVN